MKTDRGLLMRWSIWFGGEFQIICSMTAKVRCSYLNNYTCDNGVITVIYTTTHHTWSWTWIGMLEKIMNVAMVIIVLKELFPHESTFSCKWYDKWQYQLFIKIKWLMTVLLEYFSIQSFLTWDMLNALCKIGKDMMGREEVNNTATLVCVCVQMLPFTSYLDIHKMN